MNADSVSWLAANQRHLMTAVAEVRRALQRHIARAEGNPRDVELMAMPVDVVPARVTDDTRGPWALDTLCATFALSDFERAVLLLTAGMELDPGFGSLCDAAQGAAGRSYPTFSLAMAALPDPEWFAITPDAPLRHWRLIEVGAGTAITLSPLRIDERILHYLVGVEHQDERLGGIISPLEVGGQLVPSHRDVATRVAALWAPSTGSDITPLIQFCGGDMTSKLAVAATACAAVGLQASIIPAGNIPAGAAELESLARLWEREAALGERVLLVNADDVDAGDPTRTAAVNRLIDRLTGPLAVTSRERWAVTGRPAIAVDIDKPTSAEQHALWERALGPAAERLNGRLALIVSQFNLSPTAIEAAAADARRQGDERVGDTLWDACRRQARPRMEDLAQRIEPVAGWEQLILPEQQLEVLRAIVAHVRQRARVYDDWGFARREARGLGISALFAGPSGTGKTLAAEVLANELRLDLYRVDLSQVVSKYIGETEKNLRRLFDAAEDGGAILQFDEADAIFGKRSDVRDSHDRYANIEVSYLLQRMEAYRGLAILTTNLKSALDPAFLRRIRFVAVFPFPDRAQRADIWRQIFPAETPVERLDSERLAQLDVAGGNIRSIALNAAFLAADEGRPVGMAHMLRAARAEYAKLEKPLSDAEIRGWL
jgi:hypothetical protein